MTQMKMKLQAAVLVVVVMLLCCMLESAEAQVAGGGEGSHFRHAIDSPGDGLRRERYNGYPRPPGRK